MNPHDRPTLQASLTSALDREDVELLVRKMVYVAKRPVFAGHGISIMNCTNTMPEWKKGQEQGTVCFGYDTQTGKVYFTVVEIDKNGWAIVSTDIYGRKQGGTSVYKDGVYVGEADASYGSHVWSFQLDFDPQREQGQQGGGGAPPGTPGAGETPPPSDDEVRLPPPDESSKLDPELEAGGIEPGLEAVTMDFDGGADDGRPVLRFQGGGGFHKGSVTKGSSPQGGGLGDDTAAEEIAVLLLGWAGKGGGAGGHGNSGSTWGDSGSDETWGGIDSEQVRGGHVAPSADNEGWGDLNHPKARTVERFALLSAIGAI